MDDPDPNEAYDITQCDFMSDWHTVRRNGIPVWHGPIAVCERFVSDPEYRGNLMAKTKARLA